MNRNYRWLNSAGGLTESTDPTNIHVTKSPGTLPPRRARRIRSVKTPRPSSMTPARRHIHTSKSPDGLLQRNPEIHSRVQIAAVHAHEHDPAEHSHCQNPMTDASGNPRRLAGPMAQRILIGLGLTTRCPGTASGLVVTATMTTTTGVAGTASRLDCTPTSTTTWT